MFTYVNDKKSAQLFYDLVEKTWTEKFGDQIMNEIYRGDESEKIILMNDQGESIGTFEAIPYHPSISKMEFNFHNINVIKRNKNVMEIDKFAILKEYASLSSFGEGIIAMMEHAVKHNVSYYVHCIQKNLMDVLMRRYGFPIERVGEDILIRDSINGNIISTEVPTIIPMGHLMTHLDDYKGVKRLYNRRKILIKVTKD